MRYCRQEIASRRVANRQATEQDYERVIEGLREELDAMQLSRVLWRQAALELKAATEEGGAKGRPMDLISRRDWLEIVRRFAAAQQQELRQHGET